MEQPEQLRIETPEEPKVVYKAPKTIPDNAIINVRSNVYGTLVFTSQKTGERIVWENEGEVQQMSLNTLRTMKAEGLKFFVNQWIIPVGFADENADLFTVQDIFKALYVEQYYSNLIQPSNFEEICSWTPDEIKEKVKYMNDGAKFNLAVALHEYIEKGVLDSVKSIKAFEEALGCEFRD